MWYIDMREKDNLNCPDKSRPKISRDDINSCSSESFWDNIEIQKNEITQKIQDSDARKYRNKILVYLNDYINTLNFKLNDYESIREELLNEIDDIETKVFEIDDELERYYEDYQW